MKYKLSEITLNITDGTHSTIRDIPNGEFYLLSCKNIKNDKINISDNERRIDYITLEKLKKRTKITKDDILLTTVGTIGEMAMVPDIDTTYDFQRSVGIIKPNNTFVIPKFLFYAIKNEKKQIFSLVKGAVQQCLFLGDIKNIEIDLPPLETQHRIASILSALDDKIELNNQINKNLYSQIQTICDEWFTNCPLDWEYSLLSEIANFESGYSYKGNELQESNIAMATIKNFDRTGGFKLDGFKEIVPSSKLKNVHHVELFDTLVAHTDLTQNAEVIGNAELMLSKANYEDIIFSMDVVKVTPKTSKISKFMISALLHNDNFKAHCLGYVNGTTVLHLSKKALPEYKLKLPKDLILLKPLDLLLEKMYMQIANGIEENRRLAELRDTLLPKLMNGEIDVSEVKI